MDHNGTTDWSTLRTAYGYAEEVPNLLESLRESARSKGDAACFDEALSQLWDELCHQGTVYESAVPALPFLIELVVDPSTARRSEVLELLGAIANGESGDPACLAKVHSVLLDSFERLECLLDDKELRLSAGYLLSRIGEKSQRVASHLRRHFNEESSTRRRAGCILLLGKCDDRSDETVRIVNKAAEDSSVAVRRAAAVAIAKLRIHPLTKASTKSLKDAICDQFEFKGLPWDGECEVCESLSLMKSCLPESEVNKMAARLVGKIDARKCTQSDVFTLLTLLFDSSDDFAPAIEACTLSSLQSQAIKAIHSLVTSGQWSFIYSFERWGLPSMHRD